MSLRVCPVCRDKNALTFTFKDGTYECECGAYGPIEEMIDEQEAEG